MKHITNFEIFSGSIAESLKLNKNDEILDKMTIEDFDGKNWDLNVVKVNNDPDSDEEVYIVLTGKYADQAYGDSIMIPVKQWDEFKKLVSSI